MGVVLEMDSQMNIVTYNSVEYDSRHGGPFDRGCADSYYGRPKHPHYFEGATYQSEEIFPEVGSPEYAAYMAGYDYNEESGGKKEW